MFGENEIGVAEYGGILYVSSPSVVIDKINLTFLSKTPIRTFTSKTPIRTFTSI